MESGLMVTLSQPLVSMSKQSNPTSKIKVKRILDKLCLNSPQNPERKLVGCLYTQQYPAAVIQCADCGLGFRSRTPTIEEQEQTYADEKMSQDYIEAWEKSWQPIFGRLLTALEKRTKGRGALLDIGSQFGLFAFLASQGGWDAYGLDPNKYTIERAKQRGVKFYEVRLPVFKFLIIFMTQSQPGLSLIIYQIFMKRQKK